VRGPEGSSPPPTPGESPTKPSSSSMFAPKNNRSRMFNSLLHRVRAFLFGKDESSRRMIVFRNLQRRVWRLYKLIIRRALKTGELERMITESQISMVPSVMTEHACAYDSEQSLSLIMLLISQTVLCRLCSVWATA
jgi:hypothetical protein